MEETGVEESEDHNGSLLASFSKLELLPKPQEQVGIRIRHSMVWEHALKSRTLIRQVSQGVSLLSGPEVNSPKRPQKLTREQSAFQLHRRETIQRTTRRLLSYKGGLGSSNLEIQEPSFAVSKAARRSEVRVEEDEQEEKEEEELDDNDEDENSEDDESSTDVSVPDSHVHRSHEMNLFTMLDEVSIKPNTAIPSIGGNQKHDRPPSPQPQLEKPHASKQGNPSNHQVEYMPGERLFYGCRVSLQSLASGQFLMAMSSGSCETEVTEKVNDAATFTIVDLDDLGNNGMIKFGDALWLQATTNEVVAARISYDIRKSHTIEKVGTRVGKPVMRKLDRTSNLNAKWIISRPRLPESKGQPIPFFHKKQSEVGHLSYVCLEQDWHYLADDEYSGTSIRQGLYCPNGVVEAGSNKGIENAAMWRIHLIHNGGRVKTVPRDELVLSTAQQQLKATEEKMRQTTKFTRSIRGDMRKFAKQREKDGIHRLMHMTNIMRRPKTMNSKSTPNHSRPGTSHTEKSERSPQTRITLREIGTENESVANNDTFKWGSSKTRASNGWKKSKSRRKRLEKARVALDAAAAEALVSREVWAEIQAQEAFIEQQLNQDWNTAALALQKAWRKWARGKWKRKLEKLDHECRIQVDDDIRKDKEAAAAAAILNKVVDRAQQDGDETSNMSSVLSPTSPNPLSGSGPSSAVESTTTTPTLSGSSAFLTDISGTVMDSNSESNTYSSTSSSSHQTWFESEPGLTQYSDSSFKSAQQQQQRPQLYRSNTRRYVAAVQSERVSDKFRLREIRKAGINTEWTPTTTEQLKILHSYKPLVYHVDDIKQGAWKTPRKHKNMSSNPLRNAIGIHKDIINRAKQGRLENRLIRPQTAQPLGRKKCTIPCEKKTRPKSAVSFDWKKRQQCTKEVMKPYRYSSPSGT